MLINRSYVILFTKLQKIGTMNKDTYINFLPELVYFEKKTFN